MSPGLHTVRRTPSIRRPGDASDRSPAIWRGRVAFTRTYDATAGQGLQLRLSAPSGASRLLFRQPLRERSLAAAQGTDFRGDTVIWLSRQRTIDDCRAGNRPVQTLRKFDVRAGRSTLLRRVCATASESIFGSVLAAPLITATGSTVYLNLTGGETADVQVLRHASSPNVLATLPREARLLADGPGGLWSGQLGARDLTLQQIGGLRQPSCQPDRGSQANPAPRPGRANSITTAPALDAQVAVRRPLRATSAITRSR